MPTSDCFTCQVASSGAAPGLRKVSTRATRYCAVMMPPNTSGAATTATSRKCPMRAPAVKSTTPARIATSNAIERFGSRKINATSGARITRKGSRPFRNVRICSPFFAASIAVQTTTANLASSDGCSVTNPRSTQRRAPLSVGATRCVNGSSGMTSSTVAAPSTGQA